MTHPAAVDQRESTRRATITLDDFMTGLLAGLARNDVRVVSIRGSQFYSAIEKVFHELEKAAEEGDIRLRFWITRNQIHGDSPDVREGIAKAVQRDLVSLDNPEYQDMRLKIGPSEADAYLENLAGGTALYDRLARVFLEAYPAYQ